MPANRPDPSDQPEQTPNTPDYIPVGWTGQTEPSPTEAEPPQRDPSDRTTPVEGVQPVGNPHADQTAAEPTPESTQVWPVVGQPQADATQRVPWKPRHWIILAAILAFAVLMVVAMVVGSAKGETDPSTPAVPQQPVSAPANPTGAVDAAPPQIQEDDPRWDADTMGNRDYDPGYWNCTTQGDRVCQNPLDPHNG